MIIRSRTSCRRRVLFGARAPLAPHGSRGRRGRIGAALPRRRRARELLERRGRRPRRVGVVVGDGAVALEGGAVAEPLRAAEARHQVDAVEPPGRRKWGLLVQRPLPQQPGVRGASLSAFRGAVFSPPSFAVYLTPTSARISRPTRAVADRFPPSAPPNSAPRWRRVWSPRGSGGPQRPLVCSRGRRFCDGTTAQTARSPSLVAQVKTQQIKLPILVDTAAADEPSATTSVESQPRPPQTLEPPTTGQVTPDSCLARPTHTPSPWLPQARVGAGCLPQQAACRCAS